MALIDEGETDWKVLAIDINDPLAPKLNGNIIGYFCFKVVLFHVFLKNINSSKYFDYK